MASVISKRKGNKTYYYVVTSARVNGQPRMSRTPLKRAALQNL